MLKACIDKVLERKNVKYRHKRIRVPNIEYRGVGVSVKYRQ